MMTLGQGRHVVPYLAWCVLCMDATPNLCTARYLYWRIRVFACAAGCLEQAGDVYGAAKAGTCLTASLVIACTVCYFCVCHAPALLGSAFVVMQKAMSRTKDFARRECQCRVGVMSVYMLVCACMYAVM
jgi:hypothetical protein